MNERAGRQFREATDDLMCCTQAAIVQPSIVRSLPPPERTLLGINGMSRHDLNRRELLQIGVLGLGGLNLADVLRLQAHEGKRAATTAKSVIMVYLPGGPSHIDMYDPKPDAPAEFRGEFATIGTNVPGLNFCELMPLQAQIADKLSVIRGIKFL